MPSLLNLKLFHNEDPDRLPSDKMPVYNESLCPGMFSLDLEMKKLRCLDKGPYPCISEPSTASHVAQGLGEQRLQSSHSQSRQRASPLTKGMRESAGSTGSRGLSASEKELAGGHCVMVSVQWLEMALSGCHLTSLQGSGCSSRTRGAVSGCWPQSCLP